MKTQSLHSRVMKLAWNIYNNFSHANYSDKRASFGQCLKSAWQLVQKVNYKLFLRNIFSKMSFVSVNKTIIDSEGKKIDVKGTKDFWRISKMPEIRKSQDPEVRELVEAGMIPLGDIINERKKSKNKYTFTPRRERVKRKRITYNPER